MRSLGFWICVVTACGCYGERLVGFPPPGDRDAGVSLPEAVPSGDPPGDGGAKACAPQVIAEHDAGAAPPPGPWSPATAVPFSCDPLPGAFFFGQPTSDTPGVYARCASFAEARASALAVSPDGTRVALIGTDGIARIVDVASHTVVGVLAPPRASVDLAAFSPKGDTILTVQKGERTVILWRVDTSTPVWTTELPGPGHSYFNTWPGAVAFSPTTSTALVSPGADLFLLDSGTGQVFNARPSIAVLGAAFGPNDRVVVEEAPVSGTCVQGPVGGTVTVLEPLTLAPLSMPMTWPPTGDEPRPPPGRMVVAAGADLLLTTGTDQDPTPRAFRISDGTPLPAPSVSPFPLALTPDGTNAIVASSGQLQLQRVSDGTVLTAVSAVAPTALAVSADGNTVAAGSGGANLLDIWRPASGVLTPTCSADTRPRGLSNVGNVLSADGQTLAQNWGTQVRLWRRSDGTRISTIDGGTQDVWSVSLSTDAAYALVDFVASSGPVHETGLFRTKDGALFTSLVPPPSCGSNWFSFSKVDTVVNDLCSSPSGSTLLTRQSNGQWNPDFRFAESVTAAGFSDECLVMVASSQSVAWRACSYCSDPPFTTATTGGVLSQDGTVFLGQDPGQIAGVTLWQVSSSDDAIRQYPPRAEESTWNPSEIPVAISAHGDRAITTAQPSAPCGNSPGFTSRVHDVASDTILDELPPHLTSASADLNVVSIGSVLWCAR
jgi:WD40 repeat protein